VPQARSSYSALIINSSKYQSISSAIPTTFVSSGIAGATAVEDPSRKFAGVFLDPAHCNPGAVTLIATIHKHRPATPIFLLYEETPPFSDIELQRLAVHGLVSLPLSSWSIKDRIGSEIFNYLFDLPNKDPSQVSPTPEDHEYQAVLASDFLTGTKSNFDVFLRLPNGKYVKILQAQDIFAAERVLNYIEKGVSHFYLKRTSVERCLSYCDSLTTYLIRHPSASIEVKASEVMNRAQKALQGVRQGGFQPIHWDYTDAFLSDLHEVMRQIQIDKSSHIRAFLDNITAYDRGVAVTMVAALLALPLKVETDAAFRAIGLAALFHDIALYSMPPNVQLGDEAMMSTTQVEMYHTHPERGAAILAKVEGIDAVTVQAVAQHHERRNNRGFPGKVEVGSINRVAELVGIADEFVKLLLRATVDQSCNVLQEMEDHVFDGFSYPIIQSFREVFMRSSRPNG